MTREEAIKILEGLAVPVGAESAFDMAIDALRQTKQIGCTGCEHYDQQQTRLICHDCRRYYSDKYKGGEEE